MPRTRAGSNGRPAEMASFSTGAYSVCTSRPSGLLAMLDSGGVDVIVLAATARASAEPRCPSCAWSSPTSASRPASGSVHATGKYSLREPARTTAPYESTSRIDMPSSPAGAVSKDSRCASVTRGSHPKVDCQGLRSSSGVETARNSAASTSAL